MKEKLKIWIRALRAPFFQAAIIPVIVGSVVAWYEDTFSFSLFLLCLVGIIAAHAGTNLINDYYDYKSGADNINKQVTPFSGGSRVIQEKLLKPQSVFIAAMSAFVITVFIGIYLVITRGLPVLWFGLAGLFIGLFYTAPPFKLGYRGLGELVTGIGFGPLPVVATYYVHTLKFSWNALWASLPIGLLVATILYINEFPDYKADKAAGKTHLIVSLGLEKALKGYYLLLILIYGVTVLGVVLRFIPLLGLLLLLTIPLALKAVRVAREHYKEPQQLIPAMASTIQLHLTGGLLLSAGYLLSRVIAV